MITEQQRYCTHCGTAIDWDEIKGPSYFGPVHGEQRFYIRGECPNRRLMTDIGHSYGLVTQPGQFGPFPLSFGIMDDHPAIADYLAASK